MSVRFDVGVRNYVTYYWKLVYAPIVDYWYPVAIVPEDRAVGGGPLYGARLSVTSGPYQTTASGSQSRYGRAQALYWNNSALGCPGTAFLRTRFTMPQNGATGSYEIRSNDSLIIYGLVTQGFASDNVPTVPSGGNTEACSSENENDGIFGGNS